MSDGHIVFTTGLLLVTILSIIATISEKEVELKKNSIILNIIIFSIISIPLSIYDYYITTTYNISYKSKEVIIQKATCSNSNGFHKCSYQTHQGIKGRTHFFIQQGDKIIEETALWKHKKTGHAHIGNKLTLRIKK